MAVPPGSQAGDGTPVSFSSAVLTRFLRDDTDGRVTLILTRNNTNGNTSSSNLGFRSKEATGGDPSDAPTLQLTVLDPSETFQLSLADPGFEVPSGFNPDGTSDGPWQYARMALESGNAADFVFGVTDSASFTNGGFSHATGGNPGQFVTIEDTVGGGDSRGVGLVGQELTVPFTAEVFDGDLSLDVQRYAPQSNRATQVGVALYALADWEARQPGSPLLSEGSDGWGTLWRAEMASHVTNSDDLTWTTYSLDDSQIGSLLDVLNEHTGEPLVLAAYSIDFWQSNTPTFTYLDNFQASFTFTIPEPGTFWLLGLAALLLAPWLRRTKAAR